MFYFGEIQEHWCRFRKTHVEFVRIGGILSHVPWLLFIVCLNCLGWDALTAVCYFLYRGPVFMYVCYAQSECVVVTLREFPGD